MVLTVVEGFNQLPLN